MGRRFSGGPLLLPGFWSGQSKPWIIAVGTSPVSAVTLKIVAISWCMVMGACLMNSACSLSEPSALSFPSLLAMDLISWAVNFFFMGHGGVERNSSFMVSGARVFLKYCSIILIFSDVDHDTLSSSSLTRMGILGLLISLIT